MIKLIREAELTRRLQEIIDAGWHDASRFGGSGKGGALLESLLGIDPNNISAPDAVEFEIKTKLDRHSLVTLFHQDPTRAAGAMRALVRNFGWTPKGKKDYPPGTLSFRHTVFGETKRGFSVAADDARPTLRFNPEAVAPQNRRWLAEIQARDGGGALSPAPFWTMGDLIRAAAGKTGNMVYLEGERSDKQVRFLSAAILRKFLPSAFVRCLRARKIAIDFDARTEGAGLRNHGTKFRIRSHNLPELYEERILPD